MPPIATELMRHSKTSRGAMNGLMHRSKVGEFTSSEPRENADVTPRQAVWAREPPASESRTGQMESARYAEQAISARCRGIGGSTASVCRERASSQTTGQIALSAWTAKRCKLRGCRGILAGVALTFCAPADAALRSSMLPVVGRGGAGIAMISVMRAARPRRITVNSSRRRRSGSGWPAVEICWSNFRRSQRECTGGAITA
jgi:hypothetical protein